MNIRRSHRIMALASAMVMLAASCGSSSHKANSNSTTSLAGSTSTTTGPPRDTTGITPTTITIGQISTISGPIPGGGRGAFDALKAYVNYVNANGGVDGHQLELVQKDDALTCSNDSQFVQSLAGSVFASVGTFALLDSCEQRALAAKPTFPDIQAYVLDSALLSLPNVTAPSPAPYGYQTTGALWIKNKYPQAIAHTGQLYVDLSQASANNIRQAYQSLGYKYVYSRGIGLTETNFTSDVIRMKSEGVQVVDLGSVDEQIAADFLKSAAQQNFHPPVVISAVAYDPKLFSAIGAVDASNLYMPLSYPMFLGQDLGTNPALATLTTWMDKMHPGEVPDLYAVDAWAAGVLFVQALRASGATPTRTGLLAALSKITNFSADGLLPPADPGGKQGSTCMVIAGVQGNKFVRLDPPSKGFECDGTYHHLTAAQSAG
jgi:ABC-type branched-subunit amino acid transport system substrate-binding protein